MSPSPKRRRWLEVAELGEYESGPDATQRATATALARAAGARAVVLVEGISDQIAIDATARRLGRDLAESGVVVVPIGGAHAVAAFAARFDHEGGPVVLGLCDRAEAGLFDRALGSRSEPKVESGATRERVVFVCEPDLEAELIAAIDPADLLGLLDTHGDLDAFGTMSRQQVWRKRPFEARIHRWIRSHARRSSLYAGRIIEALDPTHMPGPLVNLVASVEGAPTNQVVEPPA